MGACAPSKKHKDTNDNMLFYCVSLFNLSLSPPIIITTAKDMGGF